MVKILIYSPITLKSQQKLILSFIRIINNLIANSSLQGLICDSDASK